MAVYLPKKKYDGNKISFIHETSDNSCRVISPQPQKSVYKIVNNKQTMSMKKGQKLPNRFFYFKQVKLKWANSVL